MPRLPKIMYVSFDQVPAPKGASAHISEFVKALGNRFSDAACQPPSDGRRDVPLSTEQPQGQVVLVTPDQHDHPVRQFAPGVRQLRLGCAEDNPLGRVRIFQAKLKSVLQRQPFDLIHFRSIFEGMVVINGQLNRGAKLIYEANGFPSIEMKYHYPQLIDEPALTAKLERQESKCLHAVDQIITVSEVTRQFILGRLSAPKPIVVIRNGYSPEKFVGRYPQVAAQGPIRVAYFGTMTRWQGVHVLLEAVELVNKERRCQLTIAGPASRRQLDNIKSTIRRLKIDALVTIQKAYSQSQICGLLHQSHMTVVPLMNTERNVVQGCCPIKLIEAMASGCPVIASNLPAVQEIATPDQHYLPAKPGDARNLKNLILELAADNELGLRLSRAARDHCVNSLTWRHATEQLVAIYESILSSREPSDSFH